MAAYDLPSGPAELFEAVRHILGRFLGGQHHMRLGGGTALAARWAHRHSTDVDLFIDPASCRHLFEERFAFREEARCHLGAQSVEVDSGLATIHVRQGDQIDEVTLATSPPLTRVPASSDTVRNTAVPLESTSEILAKKIYYRMYLRGRLLPRDLYDLAVAREKEPGALRNTLRLVADSELQEIQTHLYSLPGGWFESHAQPLIRPASSYAASNAVRIAKEILAEALPPGSELRSFLIDPPPDR